MLNPKNLVILVAAGQTIGASGTSGGGAVVVGLVFVVLATLPYTVTAGYAVLGGDRALSRLDSARSWLIHRNRLIMAVVAALLGLLVIAKGLAVLL